MNEAFLAVLACPKSKKKLVLAPDEILRKVNQSIEKGQVNNQKGDQVKVKIDAALVEESQKLLYIIEANIPRLIYEQAVSYADL